MMAPELSSPLGLAHPRPILLPPPPQHPPSSLRPSSAPGSLRRTSSARLYSARPEYKRMSLSAEFHRLASLQPSAEKTGQEGQEQAIGSCLSAPDLLEQVIPPTPSPDPEPSTALGPTDHSPPSSQSSSSTLAAPPSSVTSSSATLSLPLPHLAGGASNLSTKSLPPSGPLPQCTFRTITFAPLPVMEPRKRSSHVQLGIAARSRILAQRRRARSEFSDGQDDDHSQHDEDVEVGRPVWPEDENPARDGTVTPEDPFVVCARFLKKTFGKRKSKSKLTDGATDEEASGPGEKSRPRSTRANTAPAAVDLPVLVLSGTDAADEGVEKLAMAVQDHRWTDGLPLSSEPRSGLEKDDAGPRPVLSATAILDR